jgi:hypothetical protein
MKRMSIVLLGVLAAACGGESSAPREGAADSKAAAKRETKAPQASKGEEAEKTAEKAKPEEADPRIVAIEEEYAAYEDVVLTHSAADLTDGEKEMLRHLLRAAELVEELHMLQLHPDNLKWRDALEKNGTDIEKKVFYRYQSPWCADNEEPTCRAVADAPAKRIGFGLWPKTSEKMPLTDEEYDGLGAQINGKELLSPFTVVRRKAGGGFGAIPYARTDLLGPKMKALAGELREAAKTAPDKSLVEFLRSRADAFESVEASPYDASDYDWIALDGDWEVTVGPYETYKDPYQLKALFEMYIGREDKEITASLQRFKENLQEMENALGQLVGEEIYKSRKLDPRIAIRAVDIWMASGDGRRDRGATVAFHLPNRGASVDEGLYKKVMMVNHSEAFEGVSKARAGLVLEEAQQPFVDVRADITNVTFHEFSHGFGAYHEMKVETPSGKESTVKQALKELDSLLEEAKADTLGLWLIQYEKSKGWLDEEALKKRYTSGFMHILGLLQYPLAGTYPRMVAIQVGWYLDAGAVTWNPETGRFTLDYEKLPAAIESLTKEVATIQLTGDYARGRKLVDTYIAKEGDEYSLKGKLGEARDAMLAKFKAAGIKSPSLRYEVTGL